jgi:hypothetical protein
MSGPKMFRQESGIAIEPDIGEEYYLIRSIAVDNDSPQGNMILDTFLMELFQGINTTNMFELFGHPSTLLCDNTSIVMASQIYERVFTTTKKEYADIKTISEYFTKRNELKEGSRRQITWLGKPSMVFNYKNRNRIKQYLNNNTVINLFFWITSFNSSRCIYNFSKEQDSYCDKYKDLKKYCNTHEYQAHDTFLSYKERKEGSQGTRSGDNKFLTNFSDVIVRIREEDKAIDEYNTTHNDEGKSPVYQRYNEVFTYFFPWDISGIEIGLTSTRELNTLLTQLQASRMNTIEDIRKMIAHEKLISTLNVLISLILTSRIEATHAFVIEYLEGNYTFFLIAKLLLLSICDIEEGISILKEDSKENILLLLQELIKILSDPLILYEYKKQDSTNKFIMTEVGIYEEDITYVRVSDFILLEQEQLSGDVEGADPFLDKEHEKEGYNVDGKLLTIVFASQQLGIDDVKVGGKHKKTVRYLKRPILRKSRRNRSV